jgi:hypothetical protein
MGLHTLVTHDGPKNCALQLTGYAPFSWVEILDAAKLQHRVEYLVVDAAYWAVQDKTEVLLGWGGIEAPWPFLPLAGRSRIDFSEVKGLQAPSKEAGAHLCLEAFGEGLFTVVLDLSKHVRS